MVARRLIIVLGILFAISIAAAAIAPQRRPATATETTTTTTTETTQVPPIDGGEVSRRLVASPSSPGTVRAAVGDQLSLSVAAAEPLEVEIAPLGLIANAAPAAPALFDLLLRTPGEVPITDATSGRVVGRLLVRSETTRPPK